MVSKKNKIYVVEYGKLKLTKIGLRMLILMVMVCAVFSWLFFNFICDEKGPRIKPNENIKVNILRGEK